MLNVKETLDGLEARISRANTHWGFVSAVNLGLAGWLGAQSGVISPYGKALIAAVLLMFYGFAIIALHGAQREMNLLNDHLREQMKTASAEGAYAQYLHRRSFRSYPALTVAVCAVLFIAAVVALWLHP